MGFRTAFNFNHPEAFCHMRYATDDGSHGETIWNSRDGVTPFMIHSKDGREMHHVDWPLDCREIHYQPKPGERIFVDCTRELVLHLAEQRVEDYWENPDYPLCEAFASKENAVDMFLQDWLRPGAPALVEVQPDGSYKHA